MEQKAKIRLTIDGNEIDADEGTTILDAAQQHSIHIPTLCHHPALSNWGGCRICMVEVDGSPRLVASCVMPIRQGMEVVTSNERILQARRTVLEFLFAERNHYCMFCGQSGDCELQSLAYELQMDHLTVPASYQAYPTDTTDENIVIDHNRCILCGRCVRACQEIAGSYVLSYQNRGSRTLIGKDLNEMTEGSSCLACGVCMQVCPTGAMFDRHRTHYAVKGKARDWEAIESLCPQCGLMCPTISFVKDNNLLKIEGKLNGDRPDRGQLCQRGRFEPMKHAGRRLLQPMIRGQDGRWVIDTWEKAVGLLRTRLAALRDERDGEGLFALASSRCANEELFLFRDLMAKGWGAKTVGVLDGSQASLLSAEDTMPVPYQEASWRLIPESDFILVVGGGPNESQPVLSSLIRRSILEKGTKLAVIGQEDVMFPWTSCFVPVRGEGESLVVRALLGAVGPSLKGKGSAERQAGTSNPAKVMERAGLEGDARVAFTEVAQLFIRSDDPMIIAGDGAVGTENPGGLEALIELALLKGLLADHSLRLLVLKPSGNSAGAWKLGLSSYRTADTRKPWRGGVILLGGEEVTAPGLLDRLEALDLLAVLSPYFPESLTDKAHVLIPKPLWMEEEGTYTSVDGREVGYKRRVLQPPRGLKATWETILDLAQGTSFGPGVSSWEGLCQRVKEEMRPSRSE